MRRFFDFLYAPIPLLAPLDRAAPWLGIVGAAGSACVLGILVASLKTDLLGLAFGFLILSALAVAKRHYQIGVAGLLIGLALLAVIDATPFPGNLVAVVTHAQQTVKPIQACEVHPPHRRTLLRAWGNR